MIKMPRTARSLEELRRLAVLRIAEGWKQCDVAAFLGVTPRSVRRWWSDRRRGGEAALIARPGRGRPCKLDANQAEQVLSWLDRSSCEFGFATQRWTAPRLARVIQERLDVRLNHRYLNDWLRRHGVTPQMPEPRPRERDQALIDAWVKHQWPRIKKRRATFTPALFLRTKVASC